MPRCFIAYFMIFLCKQTYIGILFLSSNPTRTHCVRRNWFWRKRGSLASLRPFRRFWSCPHQVPVAHPVRTPQGFLFNPRLKIKMPPPSDQVIISSTFQLHDVLFLFNVRDFDQEPSWNNTSLLQCCLLWCMYRLFYVNCKHKFLVTIETDEMKDNKANLT